MKTFKELRKEQNNSNFNENISLFTEEDYEKFLEEGIFSEEEINEIKSCLQEYSVKEFGKDVGDVAAGYSQGLLGKRRFKKWGGKARSFFTGKSPEEEEKKIEKSQQIRQKRSPSLFKTGEKVGQAVPAIAGAVVGSRVGGKLVGGTLGRVVGGVTGGAVAGGGAEYLRKSQEERERLKNRAEELKQRAKEKLAGKTTTDAAKPTQSTITDQPKPTQPTITDQPKPTQPTVSKTLPGTKPSADLEKAKELIKKREASTSPIYKVGDVLGKAFGGSKEVESGVADTYSRLAKDPKAAAEFLRIQQQRNKEMGIK